MSKRSRIVLASIVFVAVVVVAGIYSYPSVVRFFAIDNCLDWGGEWHDEKCVHERIQ